MKSKRPCKVLDCPKHAVAGGYCAKHYARLKRHGDPLHGPIASCKIDGCEGKHRTKGYCNMHYKRFKKYGDPLFTKNDGSRSHPLYGTHDAMKQRCNNPNNDSFSYYGGRGITVCERWQLSEGKGFWNFVNDMGPKPEGYTLDRINNEAGYSPDNCRWASGSQQAINTRLPITNKSGHKGVFYDKRRGKWISYINRNKKRKYLGYFDNKKDAVAARKSAEVDYLASNCKNSGHERASK